MTPSATPVRLTCEAGTGSTPWSEVRFLSCSVLPVRLACPCQCPFCFSRSSVSTLDHEPAPWSDSDLEAHALWARSRGATRLVVTGGGEPLLRPEVCLRAVRIGARVFDEVALFTSGAPLTVALARALADAGLSYLCWSRHAVDDTANRDLMGEAAPTADHVLAATSAAGLPVRATCVMSTAGVGTSESALAYMEAFAPLGVEQFTFKHTYVARESSLFASSPANQWSQAHRVADDPLANWGKVVERLPWGPAIRRLGNLQACHYWEPTPQWETEHGLARSSNLLSDGKVYASLEDTTSELYRLPPATKAQPAQGQPTASRSASLRLGPAPQRVPHPHNAPPIEGPADEPRREGHLEP